MDYMSTAYALIPYVRDVLVGLLPLVCLSEALKATFPFRERAVLWYIGLIGTGWLVVAGGIPAFVLPWTVHTPLTIIGYFLGVSWWFRPRPRPVPVIASAPYQETLAGSFRSAGTRRAGKTTLPEWW